MLPLSVRIEGCVKSNWVEFYGRGAGTLSGGMVPFPHPSFLFIIDFNRLFFHIGLKLPSVVCSWVLFVLIMAFGPRALPTTPYYWLVFTFCWEIILTNISSLVLIERKFSITVLWRFNSLEAFRGSSACSITYYSATTAGVLLTWVVCDFLLLCLLTLIIERWEGI